MSQHNQFINDIGKRLFELRKEKGYTQKEVAEKLGIHEKTYTVWEVGKRKKSNKVGETLREEKESVDINNANLIALADLYKVSCDYILGRSPFRTIDGENINKVIGLSDEAIFILINQCGWGNPMENTISERFSRIIIDWDKHGSSSLISALTNYAQCPDAPMTVFPDTDHKFDVLRAVEIDMSTILSQGITIAAVKYREDYQKELNAARSD